jgi:hypothetical protein
MERRVDDLWIDLLFLAGFWVQENAKDAASKAWMKKSDFGVMAGGWV